MKKTISAVLAIALVILASGVGFAGVSGIWKPADQSINIYVQTYDTGSAIAIATQDGATFYVFLDGDTSDGFFAADMFGMRAYLSIAFADDTSATGILNIQSQATTYALTRAFMGDCASASSIPDSAVSLVIEPGTKVVGLQEQGISFLAVRRGARLYAVGTREYPILMTGSLESGSEEWGGLILNGYAPINRGATALGEADTGTYGGEDPEDSSGILQYVVVAHAGYAFDPETELNGIAFQGVGSGTTVNYIQVHKNKDDGVEFFGGTVNAKHVYLTENEDDSLDWTDGWVGKVQFVHVHKNQFSGDQGIEADNLESDNTALPRSHPVIANMTLKGYEGNGFGMLLRRGTAGNFYNFIVDGFGKGQIDIDSDETFANAPNATSPTELTMVNSMVYEAGGALFEDEDGDPFLVSDWFNNQSNIASQDPQLGTDLHLTASSPAALKSGASTSIIGDAFFENVNFVGAFDPNAASGWEDGWTIPYGGNSAEAGIWSPDMIDTASACPSTMGGLAVTDNGDGSCTIASGDMTSDARLTNNKIWKLAGPVFVGTE